MKRSTIKIPLIGAVFFFVLTGFDALSQVQTARYISINSNCNAFYEYLPQDYSSGGSYPLIVFLHGLGELGQGNSSTLPAVLKNGLPNYISQGRFPTSFSVNGGTYRFIVLSPQFVAWPSAKDVNDVIDYAVRTYRVDQRRIYVTGLSMGGGGTWSIASDVNYNKRLAAIVPVCGALYPATFRTNVVADANLPVWATHNSGDPTVQVSYTNDWISLIKQRNPNAPVKKTIFNATGHDAWTTTYDPNFRESGMNIYEWMLQYATGTTTTPNQAPIANAGVDQAITLPTNSTRLSGGGSDADGSIVSYQWTKVQGPAAGSIASANTASPTISGLEQGTYWYELKVTDDKGATGTDRVAINVLAATTANQAPTANAGVDQAITLPTNSTRLSGGGADADGSIVSYQWTMVQGPAAGSIASANTASPTVSGLVQGTYWYELKVTDDKGATGTDRVAINVLAATTTNKAPTVNAGSDQTITLPTSSVTLNGTASDQDGWINAYQWAQVSGPATANIALIASGTASVTGLIAGTYVFQMKAIDNAGASATDQMTVVVNSSGSTDRSVKYVKVNVYGGTNPYNNAEWNNWNVLVNANSASMYIYSNAFKYSDGTASSIKAFLSHSERVKDNGTGYGSGMAPAEVLRYTSYSSITRTLKIYGLSTSKKYSVELYASRSISGSNSTFTVNGRFLTVNTYNNYSNKASFTDLTPNSSGEIVVEISKNNLFNYLNGFTVTESSASTITSSARIASAETPAVTEAGTLSFEIYPNPVMDRLQVKLSNPHTGQLTVKVFDGTGALRKEIRTTKNQDQMQVMVPFEKLGSGTYFIRCSIGNWTETKQVVKIK